jgi:hypothetical protein
VLIVHQHIAEWIVKRRDERLALAGGDSIREWFRRVLRPGVNQSGMRCAICASSTQHCPLNTHNRIGALAHRASSIEVSRSLRKTYPCHDAGATARRSPCLAVSRNQERPHE